MTSSTERLWCVVPAAGRGARFGGEVPKQYRSIAGKPMLQWTIERLASHPRIRGIVVALADGDSWWAAVEQALLGSGASGAPKFVRTAIGGESRADSVLAALRVLRGDIGEDEFVLVHDAARPCVRDDDIARLIDLAGASGGGLLAARVRDTLKRADDAQRVAATEPRDARWRALTPQMFRYGELVAALRAARDEGVDPTDEAMAMERRGHRPLLVEGSESNIKVTTPDDLALAEFFIAREARGS
jgi:2-C-methyl-D-erythritol 4-phosphate cytidylyltransferase